MSKDMFLEKLGYYVYGLVDPRTRECFYVGKGKGDRMYHHKKEAMSGNKSSDKLDRIRDIITSGYDIEYRIFAQGLKDENEAFVVEDVVYRIALQSNANDYIKFDPSMTNIQLTHQSSLHKEVRDKFDETLGVPTDQSLYARSQFHHIDASKFKADNIMLVGINLDDNRSIIDENRQIKYEDVYDQDLFNSNLVMRRGLHCWLTPQNVDPEDISYIIVCVTGKPNLVVGAFELLKSPKLIKMESGKIRKAWVDIENPNETIDNNPRARAVREIDGIRLDDRAVIENVLKKNGEKVKKYFNSGCCHVINLKESEK